MVFITLSKYEPLYTSVMLGLHLLHNPRSHGEEEERRRDAEEPRLLLWRNEQSQDWSMNVYLRVYILSTMR